MNNPSLAGQKRKRQQEVKEYQRKRRENRTYNTISLRNIIRNLAKLTKEEQHKAYEELKVDFPDARHAELRKDQFHKIIDEEKQRIRDKNTVDLTGDDDEPKQTKMTDFLRKIPYLDD